MDKIYFVPVAPMLVNCPKCAGKVWFGMDFDWPPELGGDYVGDRCICETCKAEWVNEDAPPEFTMIEDGESYWNVNRDERV